MTFCHLFFCFVLMLVCKTHGIASKQNR